jgi:N-acetyl-gamma-glutamyl-phosphate/LysW-gamma-L-alpha-aminoadipyl-6-phosphate reductase
VSASLQSSPAIAADRRPEPGRRIRVGIVGATGYVGSELIRILALHPDVEIVGLTARSRTDEPVGATHAHLATTGLAIDAATPDDVDALFLALPHGTAAEIVPAVAARGTTVIDLGPDFRLRNPADYPRWYGFDHPAPELLDDAVYGLPELHRPELEALRTASGRSSAAPAATRRRRSSPSLRSPGPASSATSSSTRRAAFPAPAAIPSPT